jgi:glycyl-tRNA synthetase beta chain
MTKPLLIEIGVEELPAIPLLKIIKNIENSWKKILKDNQLDTDFEFLYTPRRLVLSHNAMPLKQSDSTIELFGPPLAVGVKDGVATKAGEGFARKCGVPFEQLTTTDKGGREVLYFKEDKVGTDTKELLSNMIKSWIASMSFGKMMRWGDRKDEFIRPIRWLQVRLEDEIVAVELFGVKSGSYTTVHRMVDFNPVKVESISDYKDILEQGLVTLYPSKREEKILKEFDRLEEKYNISIERDKSLLAEVVAITENPTALLGSFDESFLELPSEVIITSMKEHQRYFAVYKDNELTNKFIVVSNAISKDFSKVIAGNERVLKPRLADGAFFYNNDLKRGLSIDGLEKIQFMDGLGSLKDKITRESSIALSLLELYQNQVIKESGRDFEELKTLMVKAVNLAKADLTSEMVYEFTELQGLMGYYYAKALGEDELVYNAIREQYMPLGEGGDLPSSIFSSIVAISIKLDTLLGLFSIGKIPTGSKDPFALRRAVNGVVRVVTNYNLPFSIDDIIDSLESLYKDIDRVKLYEFIIERVSKSLKANPSVISAVLASGERDINEIVKKVEALDEVVSNPIFKEQFTTFKRVANISKDIDFNKSLDIDTSKFIEDAEDTLYQSYISTISVNYGSYKENLEALFLLKDNLDRYFDVVMVNAEDSKIRENRQNMIGSIYKSFKEIADIKEVSV